MILRRLLLLTLVAIPACAVMGNPDGWADHPTHAPLPAFFQTVDAVTLQQICGPRAGWTYNGCAFRNYAVNRCTIYVTKGTPDWLAAHELAHCAGLDHDKQ